MYTFILYVMCTCVADVARASCADYCCEFPEHNERSAQQVPAFPSLTFVGARVCVSNCVHGYYKPSMHEHCGRRRALSIINGSVGFCKGSMMCMCDSHFQRVRLNIFHSTGVCVCVRKSVPSLAHIFMCGTNTRIARLLAA